MIYGFETSIAVEVGVESAIIYQHILNLHEYCEHHVINCYEDQCWVDFELLLSEVSSYLTIQQVNNAIHKLADKKYIEVNVLTNRDGKELFLFPLKHTH